MNRDRIAEVIEKPHLKRDLPDFAVGDTVRVHVRIVEGEKERIQVFAGTVIARRGSGLSETFAVYRVAYGVSMERVFVLHSPRIAKIEVSRKGRVRRAKLYYLRGKSGKKARVREKIVRKSPAKKPVPGVPSGRVGMSEDPPETVPKEEPESGTPSS